MQVDHPAEWELAFACGLNEPLRCTFADRYYHRLNISWRALKFEPNLELVLQKHRRELEKRGKEGLRDLAGAPQGWRGILHQSNEGTLVHAVRFLGGAGWLVDATLVWPKSRNTALENAVLASITALDSDAGTKLWQAMGLSLSLSSEYDLVQSNSKVGRVAWDFATAKKRGPRLTVERLALPEYWLKVPLRDWLIQQMPVSHKLIRQDVTTMNGHRGESLLSRGRISPAASLIRLAQARLAVAWLCPIESRVYHVIASAVTRQPDISLPQDLTVRCCRPAPAVVTRKPG